MAQEIKDIDAVILCGGLGTRLKNILNGQPKPLAEIGKRPFLDILINYAAKFGFKRFILCAGYKAEIIEEYYTTPKDDLEILVSKEKEPLDTAGAIKNAEKLIQSRIFLAMNGDSFCPLDIKDFLSFHLQKKAIVSVALSRVKEAGDYGSITLSNSQKVIKFNEKVKGQSDCFCNAGMYFFNKDILALIPGNKKFSLEYDFFPGLADKEIYGYVTKEPFLDIGTPQRYEKAKKILKEYGK